MGFFDKRKEADYLRCKVNAARYMGLAKSAMVRGDYAMAHEHTAVAQRFGANADLLETQRFFIPA